MTDRNQTPAPSQPYTPRDFLFGTEKACQKNGGNKLLKELVLKFFDEYERADPKTDIFDVGKKRSKQDISKMILKEIEATGARFLKRSMSGGWEEVSREKALEKVVQGFKNRRRQLKNGPTRNAVSTPNPELHECPPVANRPKIGQVLRHNPATPALGAACSLSIQLSQFSSDSSTVRHLNNALSVSGSDTSSANELQTDVTDHHLLGKRGRFFSGTVLSDQPSPKLTKNPREDLQGVEAEVAETLASMSEMTISDRNPPAASLESNNGGVMSNTLNLEGPACSAPDNLPVSIRLGGEEIISKVTSVPSVVDYLLDHVDVEALLNRMKGARDDRPSLVKLFGDLNVLLWTAGENGEKQRIHLDRVLEVVTLAMGEHQSDAQMQVYACTALAHLPVPDDSERDCDQLLVKAGITAVVKAMNDHVQAEDVQVYGIKALGHLARLNERNLQHIDSCGGVEVILRAMKRYVSTKCRRSPETVQQNGCSVLKKLLVSLSFEIFLLGGIATVCDAMYDHPSLEQVQADGCKILRELTMAAASSVSAEDTTVGAQRRLTRREAGLVQTSVRWAMATHPSHHKIQMDGTEVLRCLDDASCDGAGSTGTPLRLRGATKSEDYMIDTSASFQFQLNPSMTSSNDSINEGSGGSDDTTVQSNRSSTTLPSVASATSLGTLERVPGSSTSIESPLAHGNSGEAESFDRKVVLEELSERGQVELTFF